MVYLNMQIVVLVACNYKNISLGTVQSGEIMPRECTMIGKIRSVLSVKPISFLSGLWYQFNET
jgi:hypothetical protein